MSGKTFGEMTPEERKAALRRAADRLQAELNHPEMIEALRADPSEGTTGKVP